jgi:hypothetical protein
MAAERRLKDEKWCGQNHVGDENAVYGAAGSSRDNEEEGKFVKDSPGKAWVCGMCTYENEPMHLCCMVCNVGTPEGKRRMEAEDVIDLTGD